MIFTEMAFSERSEKPFLILHKICYNLCGHIRRMRRHMKRTGGSIETVMKSNVKLIPLSFFAIIALGTLLLLLPVSAAPGEHTGILTALFTATTSVCVTGLVVVDTYAHWSLFGQTVILFLMQIGGLGVVAVGSMILLIGRKKFYLGDRKLLGDSLNIEKNRGLLRMLVRIFKGVAVVEAAGMVLLATQFVPRFGWGRGLRISLFHTVSAFCNAGMDVIGPDSLEQYGSSGFVLVVTMVLIILGGIGFVVWFDILDAFRDGFRNRLNPNRIFLHFSEHSRLVLMMTAVLILGGALCVFVAAGNEKIS